LRFPSRTGSTKGGIIVPKLPAKNLAESIQSLRNSTPRLNSLTDLANNTVQEVEVFLNEECSVGIPACVKVDGDLDSSAGTYLEYRRIGPRFRIAIVESDPDGADVSVKPWSDSSRADKLQAFQLLPELLALIAEKVEQEIQKTESAAQSIASILSALRKPTPPSSPSPRK
jgi:hypothetical protein